MTPGLLLHVGAMLTCPHLAQVSILSSNARVTVGGQAVATVADQYLIAGCPFPPTGTPSPCVMVQWYGPATRVKINGQLAILATSTGQCNNPMQVPQGPPIVVTTQVRVRGS